MTGLRPWCAIPGCPRMATVGNRCEQHARHHERRRTQSDEHTRRNRWTVLSQQYRRRFPLCDVCLADGAAEPARLVAHISRDEDKRWEWSNLSGSCWSHHSRWTMLEERLPVTENELADHIAKARRGKRLQQAMLEQEWRPLCG